MYCKKCNTQLPSSGDIADEIILLFQINGLYNSIKNRKQTLFSKEIDTNITEYLTNKIVSLEAGERLIKNYNRIVKRDLIEDLKSLSVTYNTKRAYLSAFIKFGVVDSWFLGKIQRQTKVF